MITIVYAHPNTDSFNHSILNSITSMLTDEGKDYNVIDLYADGFNPVLSHKELQMAQHGKTDDPLVMRYQKMLRDTTDSMIFIFPIWWGMMPAMIKGFIDKVFMKGIIYDFAPEGLMLPMLSISPTTIITTSQEDTAELEAFFNNVFIPQVLNAVGINNVHWYNCDNTSTSSREHRQAFVDNILKQLTI